MLAPSTRTNLKKRGITFEEKAYALYSVQGGKCAICREPLQIEDGMVDHWHGCDQNHKAGGSCKKCIRGILCGLCNSPWLMWAERHPWLISEAVRDYLARRPFQYKQIEIKGVSDAQNR
jgi:hypothetical protein